MGELQGGWQTMQARTRSSGMRPTLVLPLMAAGLVAAATASLTPASLAPGSSPAAAFQRVALESDAAAGPTCAESSPLFRSFMPSRVAYWPTAGQPAPAPQAEAEDFPAPAMHQALQLCAVERFNPRRPFSGANKAVYRL
ncbi:hypothetical protein E0493_15970 [Roseomonas sp. M0104]|uniref:Uncharacterized protein n=1 Tax=Teichococcus coralli TaxID=2545983 RepID=A0A845BFH3_9PROT|nr:hypothetical protein [Pseudoroseomonas coralli]MXP64850.1 hypothetical protein [Pseudoroseomonas coralli]